MRERNSFLEVYLKTAEHRHGGIGKIGACFLEEMTATRPTEQFGSNSLCGEAKGVIAAVIEASPVFQIWQETRCLLELPALGNLEHAVNDSTQLQRGIRTRHSSDVNQHVSITILNSFLLQCTMILFYSIEQVIGRSTVIELSKRQIQCVAKKYLFQSRSES